jgi:hypothetical protein
MMPVTQTAIQILYTILFKDSFYHGTGTFTPLGGEMGNEYRR